MGSAQLQNVLFLLVMSVLLILRWGFFVEAQSSNFSFADFSSTESLLMLYDTQHFPEESSILLNTRAAALQLTSTGTCGKLMFKDKVRMKDTASGTVASFSTAFTFSITGINNDYYPGFGFLHGDGMAFTFATNDTLTAQGRGGSLCLLKGDGNDAKAYNRMFAVEFDTFPNVGYADPSDSHIGVNVNNMNSTWVYNLCKDHPVNTFNCTYLCSRTVFTAWIDYDSALQTLDVRFANGSLNNIAKPAAAVIKATNLSLTEIVDEYMYVGFSSSSGKYTEVHSIHAWSFASSSMPAVQPPGSPNVVLGNVPSARAPSRTRNIGIGTGVSVGVVGAVLLVVFLVAKHRRSASKRKSAPPAFMDQNLVPRMFTYKELRKATKNFSKSEILGSGACGVVYKGTLSSGALVAVKRMKNENKHGKDGFQAEASSLSQIRHRNLVYIRGWCHEDEELMLVYDYMCNGSLDEWLFRRQNRYFQALPWNLRHSILAGVAAALAYLHEDCVQCVLHRDIKSSNVLLDGEFNAYLGDFGLARLIDHQKLEKTTLMAGTLGYMAPEMPHTGKATKESDVYSFGILVLEVVCGTRPLDLPAIEQGHGILVDRVWRAHQAGNILPVADPRLLPSASACPYPDNELQELTMATTGLHDSERSVILAPEAAMQGEKKTVTNLLHLGLLCCHPNPGDRPSMRLVSQLLQSAEHMPMPPLPASKPLVQYNSSPEFSQLIAPHSSTSSDTLYVQESSQVPPPTSPISAAHTQTSIASATSSVLSGR